MAMVPHSNLQDEKKTLPASRGDTLRGAVASRGYPWLRKENVDMLETEKEKEERETTLRHRRCGIGFNITNLHRFTTHSLRRTTFRSPPSTTDIISTGDALLNRPPMKGAAPGLLMVSFRVSDLFGVLCLAKRSLVCMFL